MALTPPDPKNFLQHRQKLFGPNFAGWGKLIVGEYSEVSDFLSSPQIRGNFFARAKVIPERLPKHFLLLLSDEKEPDRSIRCTLRKYFHDTIFVPAQDTMKTDNVLHSIVHDFIAEVVSLGLSPSYEQLQEPTERFTIKFVFKSLLNITLTDSQVKRTQDTLFGRNGKVGYSRSFVSPGPSEQKMKEVRLELSWIKSLFRNSPLLYDYVPSDENYNLTLEELLDLILGAIGLAGILGGQALVMYVLSETPLHELNVSNMKEASLCVLETARRHTPVGNIITYLQSSRSFNIDGEELEFPINTEVSACIDLANRDPKVFADPDKFDPTRTNLTSDMLSFNTVGFLETGDTGKRTCPGRNIAVYMCASALLAYAKNIKIYQ